MLRLCMIFNDGTDRDVKGLYRDITGAISKSIAILENDLSVHMVRIFNDFENERFDVTRDCDVYREYKKLFPGKAEYL